jgi:hypothetical protein
MLGAGGSAQSEFWRIVNFPPSQNDYSAAKACMRKGRGLVLELHRQGWSD